jgi:DNA polymerase-3 subunit epsilon
MHLLLQNARTPDIKVSALGSPFESKDLLKERGYRWQPDKKIWATTISKKRLDEEVSWLKQHVYGGKSFKLVQEVMTAKNRYSSRAENAEVIQYD